MKWTEPAEDRVIFPYRGVSLLVSCYKKQGGGQWRSGIDNQWGTQPGRRLGMSSKTVTSNKEAGDVSHPVKYKIKSKNLKELCSIKVRQNTNVFPAVWKSCFLYQLFVSNMVSCHIMPHPFSFKLELCARPLRHFTFRTGTRFDSLSWFSLLFPSEFWDSILELARTCLIDLSCHSALHNLKFCDRVGN